jgi:hypothetical protein
MSGDPIGDNSFERKVLPYVIAPLGLLHNLPLS